MWSGSLNDRFISSEQSLGARSSQVFLVLFVENSLAVPNMAAAPPAPEDCINSPSRTAPPSARRPPGTWPPAVCSLAPGRVHHRLCISMNDGVNHSPVPYSFCEIAKIFICTRGLHELLSWSRSVRSLRCASTTVESYRSLIITIENKTPESILRLRLRFVIKESV